MNLPALNRFLTAFALMLASHAGPVAAQYAWTDERGIRQYSDRPPPPTVPVERILKQPRAAAPGLGMSQSTSPAPEQQAEMPPEHAPSTAEKNAAFRTRRAEQAEKERIAREEAKLASDKARHCQRALEYSRALSSGSRIVRTDSQGERQYLTDEQRAGELRETQRLLADCK